MHYAQYSASLIQTAIDVILRRSITFNACLARTCGPIVCGFRVMHAPAFISSVAPRCFSISGADRRR